MIYVAKIHVTINLPWTKMPNCTFRLVNLPQSSWVCSFKQRLISSQSRKRRYVFRVFSTTVQPRKTSWRHERWHCQSCFLRPMLCLASHMDEVRIVSSACSNTIKLIYLCETWWQLDPTSTCAFSISVLRLDLWDDPLAVWWAIEWSVDRPPDVLYLTECCQWAAGGLPWGPTALTVCWTLFSVYLTECWRVLSVLPVDCRRSAMGPHSADCVLDAVLCVPYRVLACVVSAASGLPAVCHGAPQRWLCAGRCSLCTLPSVGVCCQCCQWAAGGLPWGPTALTVCWTLFSVYLTECWRVLSVLPVGCRRSAMGPHSADCVLDAVLCVPYRVLACVVSAASGLPAVCHGAPQRWLCAGRCSLCTLPSVGVCCQCCQWTAGGLPWGPTALTVCWTRGPAPATRRRSATRPRAPRAARRSTRRRCTEPTSSSTTWRAGRSTAKPTTWSAASRMTVGVW